MILLIDADSLIFASCYRPKEEEEMFYDNLEDIVFKFDESFQRIVNDLSNVYDISKVMTFNDSRGNFRKLITKKYKANRIGREKPPMLNEIHNYVKKTYNGISGCGVETDDMVARYWKELSEKLGRDNVMIVSIDKDYLQFPALIYRYHKKELLDISEYDALNNLYTQMIVGDGADNVQYFKGKGVKFAEKWFAECDTPYSFRRKMYELFKEQYKGKARQRYAECYNLLKLRTE